MGFVVFESNKLVSRFTKRFFDLLLSTIGLVVSAPVWAVIAVCIKLDDRGPVFYTQVRLCRWEKVFRVYKFRSMVTGAEQGSGPVWASANDSRVTRIGKLLRATGADELPQLFNIFRGDMSFVGPRPERPELVDIFSQKIRNYNQRFSVQPGLTGLAQVYGRYDSSPRQKLCYDLLYIRRRSLWLDLKLISVSFWITFRGKWESRLRKF